MFSCNFCGKLVKTLRGYVLHCKRHRNEPRCLFKCSRAGCKQTFNQYGAFKVHFYRRHNITAPINVAVRTAVTVFKCTMASCGRQCHDIKDLKAHLKEHNCGRTCCELSSQRMHKCFQGEILIYRPPPTETQRFCRQQYQWLVQRICFSIVIIILNNKNNHNWKNTVVNVDAV